MPKCIFDDELPDKAFRLLVFLFQVSDVAGMANPGYSAMKKGAHITSRNTVSGALKILREHGWFNFVNKTPGKNDAYWLRIPTRFEPKKRKKSEKSVSFTVVPFDDTSRRTIQGYDQTAI